jgi:RHS repeat-associated protein
VSSATLFDYDSMGRPQRVIPCPPSAFARGGCYVISAQYNLAGQVKQLTYPNGEVVNYAPNTAGQMVSAIDTGANLNFVTGAVYTPAGALAGFVSGNSSTFTGSVNTFTYNDRLQPLNMAAASPTQTVFSISYDFHLGNGTTGSDNGNVFAIINNKDATRNQAFTYDALNRLTSAQNAGTNCSVKLLNGTTTKFWGDNYVYDAWGNLLSKSVTKCSAEPLSVAALTNNRLSGYSYDAAGNLTNDNVGHTYTYDAESRIAQINGAGAGYTYDADGNRVRKDVSGQPSTEYFYLGSEILSELNITTGAWSNYVFFNDSRVARKDFATGAVSYYFSDMLRTAAVVTDSSGTILDESDYYPWGGELQFTNNLDNHYKFTGKERDGETGLDYFGARYYSNALGRFITPDWAEKAAAVPYAEFADPQSLNLYTYVRNIPTVRLDPDGHYWIGAADPDLCKEVYVCDGQVHTTENKDGSKDSYQAPPPTTKTDKDDNEKPKSITTTTTVTTQHLNAHGDNTSTVTTTTVTRQRIDAHGHVGRAREVSTEVKPLNADDPHAESMREQVLSFGQRPGSELLGDVIKKLPLSGPLLKEADREHMTVSDWWKFFNGPSWDFHDPTMPPK